MIAETERGRIAIAPAAITQIVGSAAAESYGVVALAGRGRLSRLLPWGIRKGVDVDLRADGLAIELRVVVEHGLKLAEVPRGRPLALKVTVPPKPPDGVTVTV